MEILTAIILLPFAALFFWLGKKSRPASQGDQSTDKMQIWERELDERASYIEAMTKEIVTDHLPTLLNKRMQLVYTDEYGIFRDEDWQRELIYFVDRVVWPLLKLPQSEIAHEDDEKNISSNTVDFEVLNYRISLMESSLQPKLAYRPEMTGVEYENFVEDTLKLKDVVIHRTPASGDQGVDLLVFYSGKSVSIQCKRSASPIGNKAVQEVHAGRSFYQTDFAWVVSDAPFTKGSRQLAETLDVKIFHHSEALQFLEDICPTNHIDGEDILEFEALLASQLGRKPS